MLNKRGQEEMVGFAIIIVVVVVILVVFLWFFGLRGGGSEVESREAESFVNSFLQYTTQCEDYRYGNLDVEDLIFYCNDEKNCLNGQESCALLNETLNGILDASFSISNESYYSGYEINISVNGKGIFYGKEGVLGGNSRNFRQKTPKGGELSEVLFSLFTKP